MEFIIAIGFIATIVFLVKNNSSHTGGLKGQRNAPRRAKGSSVELDPWESGQQSKAPKTLSLSDFLPKDFLKESGDKVIDFKEKPKSDVVKDYSEIYEVEDSILTPAELKYMKVLQDVVGDKYYILSKVRVADVFRVKKQRFGDADYKWFNKIKAKHFDYVLCCPKTFRPIIVMELDDSSHKRIDRVKRDEFINKICSDSGIRIIRQALKKNYDLGKIKYFIFEKD
ncbi:DUF2726 domain-containing protein [Marinobacterium sp. AK62]|uniref:DUF2726 domain-containing protein n=1 Tax=Marinobacterium alkalitolerans TaxID=1542925 RepID=A0ABS3ZDR2_9GAMM|nr:DUF2726 domain-containing protein [Marinobacterium alkalitolerans]MBP0049838.1 DUF2726 domain-containing protein [Marinobacterium alkalitolerans]